MRATLKRQCVLVVGSLALGTTAIYIVGALLVFLDTSPTWTDFFLAHFLWMLYVPMCLLLVHLWARAQVGAWLLADGEDEMVLAWTKGRVSPSFWLRGKRESLIHRLRRAQAQIRLGEYEGAHDLLWEKGMKLPQGAPELTELARWRVELALRMENLVEAREAFEAWEGEKSKRETKARAALFAARAEVSIRMSEVEQAHALLEKASQVDEGSVRLKLSQFLLAKAQEEEATLAPSVLEEGVHEVPGRHLELLVLSGKMDDLEEPQGDSRSLWVLKQEQEKG